MTTTPAHVWDAIAALIDYPIDDAYVKRVERCVKECEACAVPTGSLSRLQRALSGLGTGSLQERYTSAFDFDPACSLDIGWHVFSDGPDRGPWLALLREDLARAGIAERGELPDHLSHLLMLIAREDDERAAELASIVVPVVSSIRDRLAARGNEFAGLLEAALQLLDGRFTVVSRRRVEISHA